MDEDRNHEINSWLLWLVTGWRWCVVLPITMAASFIAGYFTG